MLVSISNMLMSSLVSVSVTVLLCVKVGKWVNSSCIENVGKVDGISYCRYKLGILVDGRL